MSLRRLKEAAFTTGYVTMWAVGMVTFGMGFFLYLWWLASMSLPAKIIGAAIPILAVVFGLSYFLAEE